MKNNTLKLAQIESYNKLLKAQIEELYSNDQALQVAQMFYRNKNTIDQLQDLLLDLAKDPLKLEEASLRDVLSSWSIIIDKQIKFKELEIKDRELQLNRELLQQQNQRPSPLIGDFLEILQETTNQGGQGQALALPQEEKEEEEEDVQ